MPERQASEFNDDSPVRGAQFRTTHWSVVLEAGVGAENSRSALERLCRSYWYPLYVFVRRRGYDSHHAQDLTQEFFARLLAAESLKDVHPDKGRFRNFLISAMKNFLAKDHRDSNRLKRGGGFEFISWDELDAEQRYALEPEEVESADELFARRWAQTIVANAMELLRKEQDSEGAEDRFTALAPFLQGDGGAPSYADVAVQLKLTEAAVKSAIYRLRRRYGTLLRETIAHTVADEADIEDEIRNLISVLGKR